MSEAQSDLSSPKYGYDFVVAVTQESVNAALSEYLSTLNAPVVKMYWIYNANSKPQQVTLEELQALASGIVDPLTIPAGTPTSDPRIQTLASAAVGFAFAFQAEIGLPPGYGGPGQSEYPRVVTFNQTGNSVQYSLMCSQFQVVNLGYLPASRLSWLNESQPSSDAWLFTSTVNLQNLTVGSEDYSQLPKAVQSQINNLGPGQFSVQQLLFDLDNAALESIPTISGVTPGSPLYSALSQVFLGAYFSQMQSSGQPVLAYSVPQSTGQVGTLIPTACNFMISPFVTPSGQAKSNPSANELAVQTLCYECAANGDNLPEAEPFTWNWIDVSESSQYDGVVAINRNSFANCIAQQLNENMYLSNVCFEPSVRVTVSTWGTVTYYWNAIAGQTPTQVNAPFSSPSTVLQYKYSASAHDQAGVNGDMGRMRLSPNMTATVKFAMASGGQPQVVVERNLTFYLYVRSLATSASGNVVNKTITDTYNLAVTSSGQLTANLTSNTVNKSITPSTNSFLNFWTDLNKITSSVANWANNLVATDFTDLPLSVAQTFVFPGGSSFSFADVAFSENQDLVSHITYTES